MADRRLTDIPFVLDLREMLDLYRLHTQPYHAEHAVLRDLERARDGALAFLAWFVDTTTGRTS
jgi:hypothetical protein